MKKLLYVVPLAILFGVMFFAPSVFAQTNTQGGLPHTVSGLASWICGLAGWMFTGLIVLAIVFSLFAAFMYVTSQGNTESVETANKALLYIAIGITIAVLASAIPKIIGSLLGAGSLDVCPEVTASSSVPVPFT
jgi:hypothetical protein